MYISADSNAKSTKYIRQQLRNGSTVTECLMWKMLCRRRVGGLKFRRQHGIGNYIIGFYCPEIRLCIEADGNIHNTAEKIERDNERTRFLNEQGITVVRFSNAEIWENPLAVAQRIIEYKENFYSNGGNAYCPSPVSRHEGNGNGHCFSTNHPCPSFGKGGDKTMETTCPQPNVSTKETFPESKTGKSKNDLGPDKGINETGSPSRAINKTVINVKGDQGKNTNTHINKEEIIRLSPPFPKEGQGWFVNKDTQITPQMNEQEKLYAMALTRISNFNFATALALYRRMGSATAIYEHRNDIGDVVDDCSPRLIAAIKDWAEPLRRAEAEMEIAARHAVSILTPADEEYPQRLAECADAPIVLYYRGTANLNQLKVISVVGTRHCTAYGQDLVLRLTQGLRELCPRVLVVSGLAYGVDICAHRQALAAGYETVGVLAHGLDRLYPPRHRDTAREMLSQGGLLTEFMTGTNADKANFVRRNRIVAGMADATVVIESAAKGGGLITAGIARSYCRDVFAFPGAVGATYSEGCNNLIRDNGAALITSADDLVKAMRWEDDAQLDRARKAGIERSLFPDLSDDEQKVVALLQKANDLQADIIATRAGLPISRLTALLFQLEMKGVVRPLAGGVYHLIS